MRRPQVDVARLFAFAWRVVGKVPDPVVRGAFRLVADVAWLRRGAGVRQLEANLVRVRPQARPEEVRRLSLLGMRSYMRYYGESFALVGAKPDQIDARVRLVDPGEVVATMNEGRMVVMALGHLGNWDLAGAWATRNLGRTVTVAERLKPEALFQEFLRFREGIGLEIIPLANGGGAGGGGVFRELVRAARQPTAGLIPLLADRDLTARGVEVDLFGERARVAAGPAALAVSTGAPLCATSITYERLTGARRRAAGTAWGVVIEFGRLLTVPDDVPRADRVAVLTQAWVDDLGRGIARAPQDWHMLQKVFVADLDPERYAKTLAAEAGGAAR
ncbi:phosphatidylinositol mannoside acyltransferase [Cellulomonas sp. PS-H5]|uniref:phosphatidylinositol mannoside acyltransferase n=1 Tax=Cellulomonas sp. PS-H5 TaxID=2820400 RepID=UPI001C4EFA8D|nr:phosphatidylinositol mannoside acyltransferase [Cellulomonas sp. PS-H5]MBW0255299.1 phosphatidylinositol mannoside acyltransferase [Cellulomonas sp. PS-H5]